MVRFALASFMLLAAAQFSHACSCFSIGTSSACPSLRSTEAAFLGRAIVDSGEGWGKGPARVVIEEAFQGDIPVGQEVDVHTNAGTSCYHRFELGKRYVIFASRDRAGFRSGQLAIGSCSQTFALDGNELLLEAMRRERAGLPGTLVGKVQLLTEAFRSTLAPSGIRVIAETSGFRLETATAANGQFSILNVPSGDYSLRIESDQYVQDNSSLSRPSEAISTYPNKCAQTMLYVWPDIRIRGQVTDEGGNPVQGITVQAFKFDEEGELGSRPVREATSDETGRYLIRGVPSGDVSLAVNGEKYNDRSPYAPTFYSRSNRRDEAKKISVRPGDDVNGIDLTLKQQRISVALIVKVVLPDYSPAAGAVIHIYDANRVGRFAPAGKTGPDGIISVKVYRDDIYQIEARYSERTASSSRLFKDRYLSWEGWAGPVVTNQMENSVTVTLAEKQY